jgi:hypothetical protein
MKFKRRNITKKRYIINPLTIRAEVKRNELLARFIGHWNESRIRGWGHTYGYIQIESKLVECNQISRTEYKDVCENVYTTEVSLYCEFDHCKNGWTEKHTDELQNILLKYNITLERKN